MEDVDAIETIQTEVSTAFGVAIEKRKQIEGHLQAAITANGKCLNKLRALAEKKKLSANKTGAFSTKKKLEELLVKAKEEVKKAEKVWTDINVSAITEVFLIVSTLLFNRKFYRFNCFNYVLFLQTFGMAGPESKKRKRGDNRDNEFLTAGISSKTVSTFYDFPSNETRIISYSKSLFSRKDLNGGKKAVKAVEFSDDGSWFASGGEDFRVLLWPTDKVNDLKWKSKAEEMETKHADAIYCLAVSPNNDRIFSGGRDDKLLIHDIDT